MRVSITRFWWIPVLLISVTGCHISVGGWDSHSGGVSVRDGTMYMDGVELAYDRWVDVQADMGDATDASISTATGEISLRGKPGSGVSLQVHLHSEYEGDGGARFVAGKLEAVEGEGKVYINDVRGTIPEDISVSLATGTGWIRLDDMKGNRTLELDSGTGPIDLGNTTAGLVEIAMGTSDIRLTGTQADRIDVETGTGDLVITGGGAGSLEIDTGTGDVKLSGARFDTILVDSGTGDVVVEDCEVGRVEMDSGTGDLTLRGGKCESVELDSGTGDLRIKEGAVVGVKRES
ncbi:MAG: DUF4097 family beta strand repeat-containing protein [Planctomycetota bacterium]|jgi:DUF4097 and DUF4098 domain-containing protein YvlB